MGGRRPLRLARLRARGRNGFSLIELMLTILLMAFISVAVLTVFSSLSQVFNSQNTRMQSQDDARTAVNQMARYVRSATSSADNMTTQSDAIATAQPQDIEFYCDIDGDELSEKVRYYLEGTTLRMQTADPVWVTSPTPHYTYPAYATNGIVVQDAVRNGTGPIFTYYKYNSGALVAFTPASDSDRRDIVTLSISVTVNERPTLAKGNVQLATDVQIRQRYEWGLQ